jgi:transposase-like protein
MNECPECESKEQEHTDNLGGHHHFRCPDCGHEYSEPYGEEFCVDCELYECECEQEGEEDGN